MNALDILDTTNFRNICGASRSAMTRSSRPLRLRWSGLKADLAAVVERLNQAHQAPEE